MSLTQSAPLLVSPDELARHLRDEQWVIVDCRFNLSRPEAGEAAWRHAHIPGALYAHLDRDLSSPPSLGSGRHPLPQAESLVRRFSEWGIGPGVRVVAYDDAGGAVAARLWWLLRWMGHDEVSLLDGGWPAWEAAGLPVSDEPPPERHAVFTGAPGHMPMVSTEVLVSRLADPDFVLIDVRARNRYLGAEEPIDPVAGHVPGAVNLPFQSNLSKEGRFRSAAELAETFRPLTRGRAPDQVAVMCGSGVTACHGVLALEMAGFAGAGLYSGSWSEWIRSPQRPVATGDREAR